MKMEKNALIDCFRTEFLLCISHIDNCFSAQSSNNNTELKQMEKHCKGDNSMKRGIEL